MALYANPDNVTRLYEAFQYVNDVTVGNFGWGIVMALFVIIFIAFKVNYSAARSAAAASFVAAIIAILFFLIGIVSAYVIFIIVVIAAISFMATYWEERG